MTATGHAIIGTVIAAKIGNPALAIPIAVASHVAADYFPHWDTATNRHLKSIQALWRDSIIDTLFGFFIAYALITFVFRGTSPTYTFIIVIAAQALDWLTAPYLFFGWHFPPFIWGYKFQKMFDTKMDKPWGIIGQAAVLIGLVLIAKLI